MKKINSKNAMSAIDESGTSDDALFLRVSPPLIAIAPIPPEPEEKYVQHQLYVEHLEHLA